MNLSLSMEPNKTQRVTEYIEGEIRAGVLAPGIRMQGMRDLAKKFNVSYAVINSVYDALEEKGMIVRSPRSGTFVNPKLWEENTRLLALITSITRKNIEDYYEPLFSIAGASRIVPITGILNPEENWRQLVKNIVVRKPDCIMVDVEGRDFPLEELKPLFNAIPVCYCNRWEWFPERPERAVLTDYAGAYGEGLSFLRSRGHRRIILLTHHFNPQPFLNRYLDSAMKSAGLVFGEDVLRISLEQLIEAPAAVDKDIRNFHPTALFGLSDYLVHMVEEKCPSAISLEKLGFFNLWYSRIPRREFSSFKIDFGEIWENSMVSFNCNNAQVRHVKPKLMLVKQEEPICQRELSHSL